MNTSPSAGQYPRTIQAVLEATAQTYPNRRALQLGDLWLTYSQLREQVADVATKLHASGITPGDTVVLLFQNTPACAIGFLALARLNASVIPLGPETSSEELKAILGDIPCAAVLGGGRKIAQLEQVLERGGSPFISLEALLAKPQVAAETVGTESILPDRAFVYHYTSGSTGKPKAALHSQINLINGGIIYRQIYGIGPRDTIMAAVPLSHSFGMIAGLITSLLCGSRLILFERFIPNRIVRILDEERITIFLAVPFMYDLMARCYLPDTPDLSALRVCLSSGAPLSPDTAGRFQDKYGQAIYQIYGSTETGIICAQWPDAGNWPERSVGRPVMGVQVRLVDEDGQDVAPNEVANLLVKTPAMFYGYLNQAEATVRAFRDGWYITGDTARQDDKGCLYLVGRKDTFINVGGKKVNPLEVEEALLSHPLVKQALVFGSDAGSAGECVQAAVVLGGEASKADLLALCRKRLAAYKVPVQIEFLAELPKANLGKIRRTLPRPERDA